MSELVLHVAPLRSLLAVRLAEELELCAEDAEVTVDHLIRAEQSGKTDHGLVRVAYLLGSGRFGPYGRRPAPRAERRGPGRLHVEADGHLGYPVLHHLVTAAEEEAAATGVCVASSRALYPSGALGDWASGLAGRGWVSFVSASSPPTVAAPEGATPVVGTNPLCFGFPARPRPVVVDCAMSAMTHGELLLAQARGTALEPGKAVGEDGRPATDPTGLDPSAGSGAFRSEGDSHKTFALAAAVELLTRCGAASEDGGAPAVFLLVMAPDPAWDPADQLATWAGGGVRVPGEVSGERQERAAERGIVALGKDTVRALETVIEPAVLHAAAGSTGQDGVCG